MPSSSKKSYGPDVQARVKRLLKALLEGVAGERELGQGLVLKSEWARDGKRLTIETTLRSLVLLDQPAMTANTPEFKRAKAKAGESLIDLRDFLGILDDHRVQKRGSEKWHFSLRLSGKDTARNLIEFDKLWESKRSPAARPKPGPETHPKSPLKPGVPFPNVRLPENFVARPEALKAVKEKLLAEGDQTLVVSAIAGLGGLGKSVLAMALVLDWEVQARFADGILWVTLGQHPNLQTMLGDWIRELDKSRESYSAATLESAESASRYLDSLLAERQMLLVVDDVWNAAHAEWFRVGGSGCRVLVTTREAQIEGANYHSLDLMSEEEAIALVRQKLKRQWRSEHEAEVKAFARVVGYLPLALDLAADQVRGLSWAELRSEFEAERRSVALGTGRRSSALKLLDSSEAWEHLDEHARRKCSLQACFNLSLKRLNSEQLQQFAWLGILPEDVSLSGQAAAMLWDLPLLQAKKVLLLLRNRSLLTNGVATINSERTYRVHDLIHDVARSLVEEGLLISEPPLFSFSALEQAHRQFLERYRERATDQRWDRLPNDGYIHRHLTWHLEQANWTDELHALMAMSDAHGQNAWFEACDRIGQPAIFVEDVARGWKIAERGYEEDNARSIVLQCRYALMTATLNSLVENFPPKLLAVAVKHNYWTPEHVWVYVEQIQDDYYKAQAVQELASYLSEKLLERAFSYTSDMTNSFHKASSLSYLAKANSNFSLDALLATQKLEDEYNKMRILCHLCTHLPEEMLPQITLAVEALDTLENRVTVLASLVDRQPEKLSGILSDIDSLKDQERKAEILIQLVPHQLNLFIRALESINSISESYRRTDLLIQLFQYCTTEYLSVARKSIEGSLSGDAQIDRYERAKVMLGLAHLLTDQEAIQSIAIILGGKGTVDATRTEILRRAIYHKPKIFEVCFSLISQVDDKNEKLRLLTALSDHKPCIIPQIVNFARRIQDESSKLKSLSMMGCLDSKIYVKALKELARTGDVEARCEALEILVKTHSNLIPRLLEEALNLQKGYMQVNVLDGISRDNPEVRLSVLELTNKIHDATTRTKILINLAEYDEKI